MLFNLYRMNNIRLKKFDMSKMGDDCIFISATKKDNVDELRYLLYERAKAVHITRYPYDKLLY